MSDGLGLGSSCQVNFFTSLSNWHPGQLKTWMKKIAAQIDFWLSLNAFLSLSLQCDVWKLAHLCPVKVFYAYLLVTSRLVQFEETESSLLYSNFKREINLNTWCMLPGLHYGILPACENRFHELKSKLFLPRMLVVLARFELVSAAP